ncbi:MAG: TolB family protein [Phycisphaerales bacterium]
MITTLSALLLALPFVPQPALQPGTGPSAQPLDWKSLEAPLLTRHVQVTSRNMFVRAGEQYFSPKGDWIIFQGVPTPTPGGPVDPHYSMYVAKITKDGSGHVTGIDKPIRISPPNSYNTCGWFHPIEPWRVIFASTLLAPKDEQKAGFQVGTRSYKWLFPEETDIVTRDIIQIAEDVMPGCPMNEGIAAAPDAREPRPLFTLPNYDAECSYSPDGRFVLYGHARDAKTADRADVDIWVYDTQTQKHHALVVADGYDGGPFFSPDGKMICYRSDRSLDDLLQIYVATLRFEDGVPVGIDKEYQLTANGQVNWAPYWHPSGKLLVYGNSGTDHRNYEIYAVEVNLDKPASDARTHRVTFASGTDILPVFSNDGSLMMWCSQRGPKIEGEERSSSQIWIAECVKGAAGFDRPEEMFAAPAGK